MADEQELVDRLIAAPRERQLRFMASAITEFTIQARAAYNGPDASNQMLVANEAIHRICGHLRDLTDPEEAMTESRASALAANVDLLHPNAVVGLLGYAPL
jgi:hypothetical protein